LVPEPGEDGAAARLTPHCRVASTRTSSASRSRVLAGTLPDDVDPGKRRLLLTTIRSHDQFNTTIYSNDDRHRGLKRPHAE
jgi:hypothetical protein